MKTTSFYVYTPMNGAPTVYLKTPLGDIKFVDCLTKADFEKLGYVLHLFAVEDFKYAVMMKDDCLIAVRIGG